MELIRGRWSKKYINCFEDKRDYDIMRRGYMQSHEKIAGNYCEEFEPPELTLNEKKEITSYWGQFGIKIYDFNWHRMYYAVTGLHDPRFVPDLVAGMILYEYYNDKAYEYTWRDKNMFERLLPEVPMPKTYGKCIRNRLYIPNYGYLERNEAGTGAFIHEIWKMIRQPMDVVFKNTRDTGFGKSVMKYHITCEADIVSAIKEWAQCQNFIIQECIYQHNILKNFNETSTNMIRVCSWRHGTDVDILFAAARAGIPGSITDVSFVDGIEKVQLVGITKDGLFADRILDQNGRVIRMLPENTPVPAWDTIKNIIKRNHLLIDNFDIIGWDFTINEKNEPYCFEWNIQWPGTVLYQYTNGPLYGEKTEELFDFLKIEKNRDNYIPHFMRAK